MIRWKLGGDIVEAEVQTVEKNEEIKDCAAEAVLRMVKNLEELAAAKAEVARILGRIPDQAKTPA